MRRTSLSVSLLAAFAACQKPAGSAGGAPVATFSDHVITAEQIQQELSEQSPFVRARYQSIDKKKELLDEIIRLDLLADEAKREGVDQEPDVQREIKKTLVSHWIHRKFNKEEGMAALSDADLRSYYDAHKDEYERPEKLRLQVIFYKVADPKEAAKVKQEATADQKALATGVPKSVAIFADKARSRSDDAESKIKGGDIDFHTHDELAKTYGDAVAAAADALKTPNDVSPVIEGSGGLYLLRIESRQAAFSRAFDQVKETLRSRVWNERRNQAFDEYFKKLKAQSNLKIDEAELAKVDTSKPDLSAKSGQGAAKPGDAH